MKYCYWAVSTRSSRSNLIFGFYRSTIALIIHEAQMRLHRFAQKQLVVKKLLPGTPYMISL